MNDFIHGPQLSHPPDGPGGLLAQEKPHNHGMGDPVSATAAFTASPWRDDGTGRRRSSWICQPCNDDNISCCPLQSEFGWLGGRRCLEKKMFRI